MKLTFTLIALCSYCLLNAQKAGMLDSSFGVDGKIVTPFYGNTLVIKDASLQKDNKLLVSGSGSLCRSRVFIA
jgi:hypothetical protein